MRLAKFCWCTNLVQSLLLLLIVWILFKFVQLSIRFLYTCYVLLLSSFFLLLSFYINLIICNAYIQKHLTSLISGVRLWKKIICSYSQNVFVFVAMKTIKIECAWDNNDKLLLYRFFRFYAINCQLLIWKEQIENQSINGRQCKLFVFFLLLNLCKRKVLNKCQSNRTIGSILWFQWKKNHF